VCVAVAIAAYCQRHPCPQAFASPNKPELARFPVPQDTESFVHYIQRGVLVAVHDQATVRTALRPDTETFLHHRLAA
jgi:hypothetical protein